MSIDINKLNKYNTYYDRKKLHSLSKNMNKKLGDYASIIAIEELSELIQVTSKYLRFEKGVNNNKAMHDNNRMNMVEELADATIALDIIKNMAGIPQDEINRMIAYKIDRKTIFLNNGTIINKR